MVAKLNFPMRRHDVTFRHEPVSISWSMDAAFWDNRYAANDYVFGEAPNTFLADMASHLPPGPVLCLAEGEGRNAVYLAGRGHAVTAIDLSEIGLAKAQRLAAARGVRIVTEVRDLEEYHIAPGAWSGIVAIFMHLPPPLRKRVLGEVVHGLKEGGVLILEAYIPAQLQYGTGGPKSPELLINLSDLREELAGLELVIARELEREVVEGPGHTGRGAVVQVVARHKGGI